MLLIKISNNIYNILSLRFENDEFLKSKNTNEYEKLLKKIKVFKIKEPNENLEEKIKFLGKINYCREIFYEIRERLENEEFLKFSSSPPEENERIISLLDDNFLLFEINEINTNFFLSLKDKEFIKKNFKKFLKICIDNKIFSLVREYSYLNKGQIEEIQKNLIQKKVQDNIIIRKDFIRNIKPLTKIQKKYLHSSCVYNSHLLLNEKFLLKANISKNSGINVKYINLLKTISLSDPKYDNFKEKESNNFEFVEEFEGNFYETTSPSKQNIKLQGIIEGYNFYFNKELESNSSVPLIELQTNLEKLNIKGKIGDLIEKLVPLYKKTSFSSKSFDKIFEELIMSRFEEYLDENIKKEIKLTFLSEKKDFLSKSHNSPNIKGHLILYFSDDNILSRIYDKIKIINKSRN